MAAVKGEFLGSEVPFCPFYFHIFYAYHCSRITVGAVQALSKLGLPPSDINSQDHRVV